MTSHPSSEFSDKVKSAVKKNFDQSPDIYSAFEEKYHFFHTLTLRLAEWMGLKKNSLILDVGCGNGISCDVLRSHYQATVYGIDLSEAMIADARRRLADDPRIHFLVGDGEDLVTSVGEHSFDAVMYNASIFVFPNPGESFSQAKSLLNPGGVIGFSFYPRIYAPENPDLIGWAYERLGLPLPKFRTIISWEEVCQALEKVFGSIETTTWEMKGDISFLIEFFSIPAQSASLFPKQPYESRYKRVRALFELLNKDWEGSMIIGWDMAKARK